MAVPSRLQKHVEDFKYLTDNEDKYQHLLDLAKSLAPFPEEEKTAKNKVPGCVSQVYITAEHKDGKVYFKGNSNALLVKGLVALLVDGLSGLTSQEIQDIDPTFLKELGVTESLTPNRMNASYNILELMKKKAMQ